MTILLFDSLKWITSMCLQNRHMWQGRIQIFDFDDCVLITISSHIFVKIMLININKISEWNQYLHERYRFNYEFQFLKKQCLHITHLTITRGN